MKRPQLWSGAEIHAVIVTVECCSFGFRCLAPLWLALHIASRLKFLGHADAGVGNGEPHHRLVGFETIRHQRSCRRCSGFEVLRRLKASDQTDDIPVIVISALDEIDSVVRCIESGAEDYLTKPFNPTLLRARVTASLEKKWLRDREKKFIADLEQEKHRSEALLLNILPQKIVDRMRGGEMIIADRILEATILFCDLAVCGKTWNLGPLLFVV